MEKIKFIVYITTNIINSKKYIGSDTRNNPNYLGSGIELVKDIKIYGRKNFIKEIIAWGKDFKDMRELEDYYIDYYNAYKSDLFYNISKHGVGCNPGIDHHYHKNPRKQSSSEKQAYSLLKNKNKILQYNLEGNLLKEHLNLIELSKLNPKIKKCDIKANCLRKQLTCHNYIFQYENDNKIEELLERIKNDKYRNNLKKIYQYDLQGNFIKEWNSGLEIQKYFKENYNIKINSCDIHACCKGKQKTAKGFKWSYILK